MKPRYVALHVTENGKSFFLKTLIVPPFIRDHIDSVDCTLGYRYIEKDILYERWGTMFKKNKLFPFPSDVMQNSVVSTQILAKIYRPRLTEWAYHKIQQYL